MQFFMIDYCYISVLKSPGGRSTQGSAPGSVAGKFTKRQMFSSYFSIDLVQKSDILYSIDFRCVHFVWRVWCESQ